jgi:hypothetical protein
MAQHANTPPSSRRWAMVEMGQVGSLLNHKLIIYLSLSA